MDIDFAIESAAGGVHKTAAVLDSYGIFASLLGEIFSGIGRWYHGNEKI